MPDNYMSNAIDNAGRRAMGEDELTPEEIEAMKQKKAGMFQRIKDMLGYAYSGQPQKQMPK